MKFVTAGGIETVVYLSEELCWNSGGVSGESVGDTEEICVVVGIVAESEVRFCSVEGVGVIGAVVGVGGGVYAVV